jgi:hypothetical protein
VTSSTTYNDRFPYDPRHLIYALLICTALTIALPKDRADTFAALFATAISLLTSRR